jgi:O-antigen/teichoic acid export membrane protein
VAVGQAVGILAGLAGTRILTSLLPPAVYGRVSLIMGLAVLGSGTLCNPFLQAALRNFPDSYASGGIGELRRITRRYLARGVAGIALMLLAVGTWWAAHERVPAAIAAFAVAAAYVGCECWRAYEGNFLNAARRQRDFAVRASLDALARPAFAAAFVLALGPSAFTPILGYATGSALVGVALRRRIVAPSDRSTAAVVAWPDARVDAFVRYALPLVPMAALNWVMSMGDRYVLAHSRGVDVVGVYVAAYALGSQPFIASNMFILSTLRPVLYDAVSLKDRRKETRTLRIWMLTVLVVASGGWLLTTLLADVVCGVFLGPAYRGAATLLPWIAAAYALQMVEQTFEIILYSEGRSKLLVVIQAAAAGAAMAFYVLFIPRYGALGAAYGTLASMAVSTVIALVLSGAAARLVGGPPGS